MNKTHCIKKYLLVSIVAIATVLTFMLCGCTKHEEFNASVTLSGGTGKAKIESANIVSDGGKMMATIVWSSKNYDYMIVDGEKYYPINQEGNSTFTIPVKALDEPFEVIADTVAMSKPHEIQYEITFSRNEESTSLTEKGVSAAGDLSPLVESFIQKQNVTKEIDLKYAKRFRILYFNDNPFIIINSSKCYLLLDNSQEVPSDVPSEVTVLNRNLNNIYVAGTGSMDYFATLDVLKNVGFSSITSENWDIDSVKDAMDSGSIIYAGKYSAPDYELLLSEGCQLALENTMISHAPEVLEKFEKINIPYLIDYSSYEDSPLGRMEWIKLYGVLTGKESEAESIFNQKISLVNGGYKDTGLTVAYFYINNSGAAVVRKNQDYVATMISMAGGKYAFSDNEDFNGTGGMNTQVESFFDAVSDCDYFIYNSTIVGEINSIEQLVEKCPVLKNTKAVKNKNVYVINKNFYQSPMNIADYINDFNVMLTSGECQYLTRIQ